MRRMRRIRTLGALTGVVTVLATAACSSGANPADVHATSSSSSIGESTSGSSAANTGVVTSPSPGAVTSSDRSFNFVVPVGWNLTTLPKTIAYLSSATIAHNVAPTIVVTKSDVTPAPSASDAVQMAIMKARQDNATAEKSAARSIGGEHAEGFTADSEEQNVAIERVYYVTVHNGIVYTVASTSAKTDAAATATTLNSVLSSWTWSKAGDKNSTASGTTPAQTSTTSSTSASSTSTSSTSSGSTSSSASSTPSSSKPAGSSTASPKPSTSSSAPASHHPVPKASSTSPVHA